MKLALMTVVYPKSLSHAAKFIESINNQKLKDFNLIIINDNNTKVAQKICQNVQVETKIINSNKSKILNRIFGLKYVLKKKYDLVSLIDFDDYISSNYIKEVRNFFLKKKKPNLFSNLLTLEDKMLQNKNIIRINDIIDDNLIGYGTLSISRKYINKFISIANIKVNIFDWFFALVYLIENKKIYINKKSKIIYNNSDSSTFKKFRKLDKTNVLKVLNIKKKLYKKLIIYFYSTKKINKKLLFIKKKEEMKEIEIFIKNKKNFQKYKNAIKVFLNQKENFSWFDIVQPKNKLKIF